MKIGIVGTRGIPNRYGGFEQFAEYVSEGLAEKGMEVWVYSPHYHPYKENKFGKVNIIHKYDPEPKIGTSGQFVYDFNCIVDSRKRDFDAILLLGYTSSSIWSFLLPKKPAILSNMDGLEWKRTKYSNKVKKFLKKAEKWAVDSSDILIADSIGIKDYLEGKYKKEAVFIPYAASPFKFPDAEGIKEQNVEPFKYSMLIARLEPENNLEMILEGVQKAETDQPFIVIGNHETPFGEKLKATYTRENIVFAGSIYHQELLNNLRYYSRLYFHGHSVGGTNPSLLEAMASNALIAAHENVFNKAILQNEGFYFSNADDVASLLDEVRKEEHKALLEENHRKIKSDFSFEKIVESYYKVLKNAAIKKGR